MKKHIKLYLLSLVLPFNIIELSHETPVPVTNLYKTPQTLGLDRLAAVVAANWLKP
jgi:type III pantothenate kinase